jgi:hypothetical protein
MRIRDLGWKKVGSGIREKTAASQIKTLTYPYQQKELVYIDFLWTISQCKVTQPPQPPPFNFYQLIHTLSHMLIIDGSL